MSRMSRKKSKASTPKAGTPKVATSTSLAGVTATSPMMPVADVMEQMKSMNATNKGVTGSPGLGFDRIEHIAGSTYKDNSTVIIIPTRGMIHHRIVSSWLSLIPPMNQKRALLIASGHEVGQAYNEMLKNLLGNAEIAKWKYVMTLEDDNIPPPDAQIRLLESIEWGGYDAVSGVYFTKGEGANMPMAYGDPEEYRRTGVLDFKPRNVNDALKAGQIMPVNGIAMGCALWRMELFRQIAPPWFVTVSDIVEGKGAVAYTQDLNFCQRAVQQGKRFAVDLRVRVGHLDINSGIIY